MFNFFPSFGPFVNVIDFSKHFPKYSIKYIDLISSQIKIVFSALKNNIYKTTLVISFKSNRDQIW